MRHYFLILALFSILFTCAQTTIQKENNNWVLLVDGKPFDVKGATFGYTNDLENYDEYFKDLQFLGVNAIRTWATGKNTLTLLNTAKKYNIKVMLGIWMRHGKPGMEADDSFNYLEDKEGKEKMYNDALKVVEKYKNHPALLTWGIGNEVYLNIATNEEKKEYSLLLESICKEIKKRDIKHPITSVEAWTFGLDWWQKYVPSIDIYGLNAYGAGANLLQSEMEKRNIDKPYVITEFGVTGEWDIKQQKNGVKTEPSDKEKYDAIVNGYKNWIQNKSKNLGVFNFHYSDGNTHMSPWLFTHHRGFKRPQYWAIRKAYTNQEPTNNIPKINQFTLSEGVHKSDSWIPIKLSVNDIENDSLNFDFFYNQRTGSRKRKDQINKLISRGNYKEGFQIQIPKENGAIKVYVNVNDTFNNVGIASTTILVEDEQAKNKKFLVPKKTLPFYVYKDGNEEDYSPSAYMGNYKDLEIDMHHKEEVHSGTSAIRIRYNETHNWYGFGLVDPPNDWGENLGGFDLTGATKFSFWAKASKKKIKATIGFGLIGKNKPYYDTAKKSKEIILTTKWKKYTIKLKKLDLSCIRSGLVIFSSAFRSHQDIFIDDVVFE